MRGCEKEKDCKKGESLSDTRIRWKLRLKEKKEFGNSHLKSLYTEKPSVLMIRTGDRSRCAMTKMEEGG
jgi:hypothetical protein